MVVSKHPLRRLGDGSPVIERAHDRRDGIWRDKQPLWKVGFRRLELRAQVLDNPMEAETYEYYGQHDVTVMRSPIPTVPWHNRTTECVHESSLDL